jgi:cellulose biosynthesis protein BcsQ
MAKNTLVALAVQHLHLHGMKLTLEQITELAEDSDAVRLTAKYLVSDYDKADERLNNIKKYIEQKFIERKTQ